MSDEEAIKIQEAGQESVLSRFRAWIVLGLALEVRRLRRSFAA